AGEVRVRERLGAARARGELNEEGAAGRDGPGEGQHVRGVEGAGRGGVLEGPAGQVDVRLPGVHELDEVVGEGRAGVSAPTVDLIDLQVAGGEGRGLGGGDEAGQGGEPEGEDGGGRAGPGEAGAEAGAGGVRGHGCS